MSDVVSLKKEENKKDPLTHYSVSYTLHAFSQRPTFTSIRLEEASMPLESDPALSLSSTNRQSSQL